MTSTAIYCRISDDRAGAGLGVKRQEADCRALAEAKGWDVAEVFIDNDTSAYSGRRRPGYEAMMADLESGRFGAVVAWHPDRLHRSPRELERFITAIEAQRVKVATAQGGEYDLSTAAGRMTARVVGAVARHESEHKSERHRSKARELAAAGKVGGGGTRPFGYADDRRTIVPTEAELIREAARRALAGEAVRGIARDFNDRDIATVTGARWTSHVLKRLLISPRIAGLRQLRGEVVGPAEWSAIIDRADHERLRLILTDPARRVNQGGRSYLLTGFARCGLCAARLVARPRADGRRCYVCASGPGFHGCGKIRVLAGDEDREGLEPLIVEAILLRMDGAAIPAPTRDDGPTETAAAIETTLAELGRDYADGNINRTAFLAAQARLEERLSGARAAVAASTGTAALGTYERPGALRLAWPGMSFDQRRAVLGALVDRVVVGPAVRGRNRFDPERVGVDWRS